MRKALVLTALAGLLLSGVAFAATTYTDTLYPSPGGGVGENWVALRGVPFDPAPAVVFGDETVIDDGRLSKLDGPTANVFGYYSYDPDSFGKMLLGEGYIVMVTDDIEHAVSYSGIEDGVPSDPVNAPGTTMTDMWVSLPGITGGSGGEHWIGHPFNHSVPFVNVKVTDGTQTLPVQDAIAAGWLEGYWTYLDAATQNVYQVDPDGINGSDQLEAGHMYIVRTLKNNLALIIPAGTL